MTYYSKIKEGNPYPSSHTWWLKILEISIGYVNPQPKKGGEADSNNDVIVDFEKCN